jgi:hypothetical protein
LGDIHRTVEKHCGGNCNVGKVVVWVVYELLVQGGEFCVSEDIVIEGGEFFDGLGTKVDGI